EGGCCEEVGVEHAVRGRLTAVRSDTGEQVLDGVEQVPRGADRPSEQGIAVTDLVQRRRDSAARLVVCSPECVDLALLPGALTYAPGTVSSDHRVGPGDAELHRLVPVLGELRRGSRVDRLALLAGVGIRDLRIAPLRGAELGCL